MQLTVLPELSTPTHLPLIPQHLLCFIFLTEPLTTDPYVIYFYLYSLFSLLGVFCTGLVHNIRLANVH